MLCFILLILVESCKIYIIFFLHQLHSCIYISSKVKIISCYVKYKVKCWKCRQKCFEWLIIFLICVNKRKLFILILVKSFLGSYMLKVENERYAWARCNALPIFAITIAMIYRKYWFSESVIYENWNSKIECNFHVPNPSKFSRYKNHFLTHNN